LRTVGVIITRMSELKTMSTDVTKNSSDIENYNKEFVELQKQIGAISKHKFNGVSLFTDSSSTNSDLKAFCDADSKRHINIKRNFFTNNLISESGYILGNGTDPVTITETKRENVPIITPSTGLDTNGNKLAIGATDSNWVGQAGSTVRVQNPSITGSLPSSEAWFYDEGSNSAWIENNTEKIFRIYFDLSDYDHTSVIASVDKLAWQITQDFAQTSFNGVEQYFMANSNRATNAWQNEFRWDASGVSFEINSLDPLEGSGGHFDSYDGFHNYTLNAGSNYFEFDNLGYTGEALIQNFQVSALKTTTQIIPPEYPSLYKFTNEDLTGFIDNISDALAQVGAEQSRLNTEVRQNESARVNLEAAKSRIMDADISRESTLMVKTNVLAQASVSMVAKANQLSDIALRLMVNR
jgi:flagellin-like hook-associated protein FlgL